MRKTMKGGGWFWSDTPVSAPVTTTPSKSLSESISDFFSPLLPKKTDTPVTSVTPQPNNIGGYMGGKRKGKTAKKPCPKKGGGK